MRWWDEHVVPRLVDATLSAPPVADLRARVCRGLHGRVLDVGFGSGTNLPHLPAAVTSVDAVEPSDVAWERSSARREASAVPVTRIGLDGRSVAAESGAYDAVLVTFTACTVPDPRVVMAEVRRLLAPGGTLHILEHGLSPDASVARWQRRLDPIERRLAGGCHLSRDPAALLREAGFGADLVEQGYLAGTPAPARPWSYLTLAHARPNGSAA